MSGRTRSPELSSREVDVALRDGSTLHVRPVTAGDRPAIAVFLAALSPTSIAFRFFGAPDLEWVANWSVDVDYADRYALVAVTGPERAIVAHGAYMRTGAESAEVAFTVADAWQDHGIATIMLSHLALAAEEQDISMFTASVLPNNHRMIQVFRDSGFTVEEHSAEGAIEIELPTSRTPETRERFEQRSQTAAIAAVSRFLEPHAVALVGASREPTSVGGALLRNILESGYEGALYPINRSARKVQGQRCWGSISELPEPVELAVIAVPAGRVIEVARECAARGVRALLVISAGFSEVSGAGAERQRELLAVCRESGMRLIGPNCFGVINTTAGVGLNATFAAHRPPSGPIGFLSQSGGLGIAIIELAGRMGLGLSSFVSVGNKADVSGNDLLEYWEHDGGTGMVLLYLESFGNPRRFSRIARRVGQIKPIAALKSGRSPAGARATSSHTGALISTSDVTVDALFRQAGVIRTDTMHELFDVGALLSTQPPPEGSRVAIVTNAGGPGILCADACQAAGLEVRELPEQVRASLREFLAPEASLANPVDMIATAPAESYRRTIETLVRARACDAIIAIFVPPLVTQVGDVAREISEAAVLAGGVTLATVFMDREGFAGEEHELPRVPSFEFPEDAARALAHAAQYGRWRAFPRGVVPRLEGCDPDRAAAIIAEELAAGGGWLAPTKVSALLACYSIPLLPWRVAHSPVEAVEASWEIGGPVALKAIAPDLVHKSDVGGVRVGLEGSDAVAQAAHSISAAVAGAGHALEGLLVQSMAPRGVELLMGVVHDESFGPVIACGAGGTSAEVMGDVAVRITPLTDLDAHDALRSLRVFRLLEGYRGAPPCNLPAVEEILLRLGALVDAHREIAELDMNPVVAGTDGAVVADARIRLAAMPAPMPRPSL